MATLPAKVAVTAHSLRHHIAAGFEPVLERLVALGIHALEMSSLEGCRGNPWGDFGAVTDWPARKVAAALRAAGMACPSTMVYLPEMAPARRQSVFDFVLELGCPRIVLTMIDTGTIPNQPWPPRANYERALDAFDELAAQMRAAGLQPVLHTQPDLWREFDGWVPALALGARARAGGYEIELDPSGVLVWGGDAADTVRATGDRLYSLHLRDGARQSAPTYWLEAEPLGSGELGWPACLAAAAPHDPWRIFEIEVVDPANAWPRLEASVAWLAAHAG